MVSIAAFQSVDPGPIFCFIEETTVKTESRDGELFSRYPVFLYLTNEQTEIDAAHWP